MTLEVIDHPRNIDHADNPVVGDYWHEMFTPIAAVLMVDDERVVIERRDGEQEIKTRREFAKWLRYSTMPNKTWADVVPAKRRDSRP